jgi:DinB superfamily
MAVPFEESVELLERSPRVLHELLAGLPESWLRERDTPDGWTAQDVVGHLISAELDDWIPRAERILEDGTSRPFDPFDRHAHIERDRGASLHQLLDRFAELRADNIERLRELVDDSDLGRRGLHPELGEVTLGELIATWTVHDLDHISQIFAALSGSRDLAVGPWKQYLGILLRREGETAPK